MPFCIVHRETETDQVCTRCRQPFCRSCLAEMFGGHYCQWCKAAAVRELQAVQPFNARPVVLAARIYDGVLGVWSVLLGALTLFSMLVSGPHGAAMGTMGMLALGWRGLSLLSGVACLVGFAA